MIDAKDVAVVVLAAGASTRFGENDKLTHPVDGKAMVRHAVEAARAAGAGEIVVVTGPSDAAVRVALDGLDVRLVRNGSAADGMGTSIACGANAVGDSAGAILVMLGDMPYVRAATLGALFAAFDPKGGKDIVAPVHDGRRGHPVLFGKRHFTALWALSGDNGARSVLTARPERVKTVPVDDPGVHRDIDTPGDLPSA